jgi:hypothetical protein
MARQLPPGETGRAYVQPLEGKDVRSLTNEGAKISSRPRLPGLHLELTPSERATQVNAECGMQNGKTLFPSAFRILYGKASLGVRVNE